MNVVDFSNMISYLWKEYRATIRNEAGGRVSVENFVTIVRVTVEAERLREVK